MSEDCRPSERRQKKTAKCPEDASWVASSTVIAEYRCANCCTGAVSSRSQLPTTDRSAASWRAACGNLRRHHTRMPCSRDSCELRVVLLGLLLNSLQVDRERPQQTRVNAEADQPRNADNYGLSSSECTSLFQVCPPM